VIATRQSRIVGRLLMLMLILSAGYSYAQFRRDGFDGFGILRGEQGDPAELPPEQWPDSNVAGCHILYTSVRREANGSGWRTDYPWGQRNLLIRLSELTKTRVSFQKKGVPHVWLVRLTDPALFGCPYLMASDVGTIGLSPEEVQALRNYLQKGGFLWVDDFWGEDAWDQWTRELARAMPSNEYTIEDVPLSDPIFHSMIEVKKIPQVPGIGFWRAAGGRITSERGEETAQPHFRAMRDQRGRIIVVMTHNTDVSNSWERETEDPQYFYQFSIDGYALGINVFLYALTH
jgi:Domain of unknown function (DUF4159)